MTNYSISALLHRRAFIARSALLSGSGLLTSVGCAQTSAGPSGSSTKPVIPGLRNSPRLPLRKNIKIEAIDGNKFIESLTGLANPTIPKAKGELQWLERDPKTGTVTVKAAPAGGSIYKAQHDPISGTPMVTLIGAVMKSLRDAGANVSSMSYFYADDDYYLPTDADMKRIVPEIMNQTIGGTSLGAEAPDGYVPGRFDCDDFAFVMKGLIAMRQCKELGLGSLAYAFGILLGDFEYIGSNHAVCFYYGSDKNVHLVDPRHQAMQDQPAKLYPLEAKDCRRCTMILM